MVMLGHTTVWVIAARHGTWYCMVEHRWHDRQSTAIGGPAVNLNRWSQSVVPHSTLASFIVLAQTKLVSFDRQGI